MHQRLDKTCSQCGESKPLWDFHKFWMSRDGHCAQCAACKLTSERIRNADPAVKAVKYSTNLRNLYGITLQEKLDLIEAQGGLCPVCKKELALLDPKRVHVDHCHVTGLVRGVLCGHCNPMLGNAFDNVEILKAGIAYLEASRVLTG